jgi:7-cyano-7-deazaguanine synthase
MCAIIGFLAEASPSPTQRLDRASAILKQVWEKSHQRGRDGRGLLADVGSGKKFLHKDTSRWTGAESQAYPLYASHIFPQALIANLRAEPTTEYVRDKRGEDQQPYQCGKWAIVHNGTIANDQELRNGKIDTPIDSAAIVEKLDALENPFNYASDTFGDMVKLLKGSYAILAMSEDSDALYYACNYRPLWYVIVPEVGAVIASSREYLPQQYGPRMLPPYTMGAFARDARGKVSLKACNSVRTTPPGRRRALVVCSGGLDSVVAATHAQKILSMDVTLLHFRYGSRAQGPEIEAIRDIAKALGAPLIIQDIGVYQPEDSPLLRKDSTIAGGEAGAEFAYEWVPARNLLMLSMATAIAEARGIETIVLGNNLEEAGAYPDNEPEFIDRFNDLLPFAVGDGKRMEVIMPVGNMMKHEIVNLGMELGAPLHLTWSCYRANMRNTIRAGDRTYDYIHCGTCGPCFMRRTAFKINNIPEVIEYEV